jgi:hypothetical protein
MLWYKAWLETRARFCIALVLCVAFCLELIVSLPGSMAGKVDLRGLHGVNSALVFVWILGVTLLMMGGLLRESEWLFIVHSVSTGESAAFDDNSDG